MTPETLETPADLGAEEAVIGACLMNTQAREAALELLAPEDFWLPVHRAVFAVVTALHHRGEAIDAQTVASALNGTTDKGALLALVAGTPASANAGKYAADVARAAWLRRCITVGDELRDRAYARDHETLAPLIEGITDRMRPPITTVEPAIDVNDLIEQQYAVQWLVEDLLERRDRFILSGPEGRGKSMLSQQFALALAAGLHPFRFTSIPSVRVLNLDLENSEAQLTRRYRWFITRTGVRVNRGALTVKARQHGINILRRADALWVEGLLRHHRPSLLVIGPLYKMFQGEANRSKHSEEIAEQVANTIDRWRVRYDIAVMIEAHSPHGEGGSRADYRPIGASLWLRWPEFGMALKPGVKHMHLIQWRGARDRYRDWPEDLIEGNEWAWVPPDIGSGQAELM